ncbi:MAG: acyl-CoA dehydrogenase family protein, partial [Gammaproteobacteria bacterium]
MDFSFTPEQDQIREAIARLCEPFDADYWLRKDREGGFPEELHRALAQAGWLGIAMPEQYGGAGLGITEAALMMQTISASGASARTIGSSVDEPRIIVSSRPRACSNRSVKTCPRSRSAPSCAS